MISRSPHITRKQTVKKISLELGIPTTEVNYVIRKFFRGVYRRLRTGTSVKMHGFGTLTFNIKGRGRLRRLKSMEQMVILRKNARYNNKRIKITREL